MQYATIDFVELTKKAFNRNAPRIIGVADIRCSINGKEDNPFEQNSPADAEIIAAVNELLASGFVVRKQDGWQIKLPDHDLKVLRDISRSQKVLAVADLPPAILKLSGKMVEVGQDWRWNDVIDDRLNKCLIWAHTDGEHYIVQYQSGGFAMFDHILFAKLEGGEGRKIFRWTWLGGRLQFTDLKAFFDFID